ncbi:PREDICTED: ankyrin repeat domain-containing protein 50-like [Ipomoea nil]|uniref:ankyrin repeat domain-containing protein 50-like n=1 Tax=Ipomoea nil TaxID=35883 RepID=UPI000900D960|nr:PREDICTED: ankyrin repeat domain-containing protein 50-like [Ipomoea nil]
MTVFTTGGYLAGKHVFPAVNYSSSGEAVSQRLVDAAHADDLNLSMELLADPFIDVNYVGTVCLRSRRTELVLHDETATEVRVEFEEFKTEITPLFLAAHNGNATLVRKLLRDGATVNHKLFRGYATTAAVREGHGETLEILLKAGGAAQAACEEALLEACLHGRATHAHILMASQMIRPHVALHALVTASSRGFIEFVDSLLKFGVDVNASARVLLQSSNPPLYANVNCNALAAAVVNRQVSVVHLLLQRGARSDCNVRLGAWFWEVTTGEEFRVGVGLAEPYPITWCAVEYFEGTGAILKAMLQKHHISPNTPHFGRTILHHAILCGNSKAVEVLLSSGANPELAAGFFALHFGVQRGNLDLVQSLIRKGSCDVNELDREGYTPLMLAAKAGNIAMCRLLLSCRARLGIENARFETALSLTRNNNNGNSSGFVEEMIVDEFAREVVLEGAYVKKHTKGGRGAPHRKMVKMLGDSGELRWGKSRKRNVICEGAEVGPSSKFRWNRRKKLDGDAPGVFRVVTTKNKEIHFECEGGTEMAELWVRGIKLVTREAVNIGRSQKPENRK